MLGEDFDMTDEEKVQRDKGKPLFAKHIKVMSNGHANSTKVTTSDGLDLCQYGLVSATWRVHAGDEAFLQLTFIGPVLDVVNYVGMTELSALNCVCDPGHWAEIWWSNPAVMAEYQTLMHAMLAFGGHHCDGCPRRSNPLDTEKVNYVDGEEGDTELKVLGDEVQ